MQSPVLFCSFCLFTAIQAQYTVSTDAKYSSQVLEIRYAIDQCFEQCEELSDFDDEFPDPIPANYTTYYGSWCGSGEVGDPRFYMLGCGTIGGDIQDSSFRLCIGHCNAGFVCEGQMDGTQITADCVLRR